MKVTAKENEKTEEKEQKNTHYRNSFSRFSPD